MAECSSSNDVRRLGPALSLSLAASVVISPQALHTEATWLLTAGPLGNPSAT